MLSAGPIRSENTNAATTPATNPTILPATTRSTVQPGGLPARSSLCRIRSPVSAPVNRRPIRSAAARSGASTRSAKGLSRSLVSSFGPEDMASSTASERLSPRASASPRAAETM